MNDDIHIQASILDGDICQFTVDRPLLTMGVARFNSRDEAEGSPLAKALFAVDTVTSVTVSHNIVKVGKAGAADWMGIAKDVGAAIRTVLRSGGPLLADGMLVKEPENPDVLHKVQAVFDIYINPLVAQHGGFVELLEVKGPSVFVRLGGGCQGCGMAAVTLKQGIEQAVRQQVPEIEEVLDVTDHASGRNPYYTASTK